MPVQEEKCFPRGGKEPPKEKPKKSPKTLKRKRESVAPSPVSSGKKAKVSKKTTVNNLSLKTLSEGMVILGSVREVTSLELKVNLPGLVVGYVPTTNISEEYSAYLKELLSGEDKEPQELSDMFKPGQLVVTRVEEISTEKKKTKVTLSLNPKIIQGDLSVGDIMEGFMLSASVQSNEDRVYVMNCGIPGARAVLKKAQALNYQNIWNDGKPLGVGQVLRCLVTKCTTSEGSSNVELTADPEKLSEAYVEKSDVPLNSVILGKCFQLSVEKVFSSGLLVNLASNQTGFVHSNHLKLSFNDIKENALLQGRVLYIEPLTRNIFLTGLENVCGPHPPPHPFEKFKKGTKFSNAKVITSKGGNVLLEFGESSDIYGLVSYNHLDLDVNTEPHSSYSDLVKEKYPPGSSHKCKVLEYDYTTQKYICTLNRSIIKQKYSSIDELTPGLVTECIVERSSLRAITLRLYGIRGFVEPIHCSDVPVRYPDALFKKGQSVKAKVLAVKNPICEFTLKPALVNSKNPILTNFSDADYGVQYDGVIVSVSNKGVLVKFYADFKTLVPSNRVLGGRSGDLEKLYYIGQLVKCYVTKKCNDEKLILNVEPYESKQSKNEKKRIVSVKVGESYTVIVKEVTSEGLVVEEHVKGVTGRIPMTQLTDSPRISLLLCQSYSKGDKLQTFCLNGGDEIVFTASPTFIKYFESPFGKELSKKGLSGLQEGMVVPSTVAEISPDELILSLPMFGETCSVSVPRSNICSGLVEDVQSLGIQKHQTLMVRILRIFEGLIHGECNLDRVCDRAMMSESGIMLLQEFMNSQKRIHNFWKHNGHPLGELKVGSQVEGTVVAVTSLGAVVDLDNGARAVVMPLHIDKDMNLEVNMHVKGTVMYLDIVNECVEITLWKHVQDMFSSIGKVLDPGKYKNCFALISRPDVLICGINHFKTFCIAYVPSRWHINDLHPTPFFPVGVREPVSVIQCNDDLMFAVPRKVEIYESRCRREKEQIELLANGADSVANEDSGEEFLKLDVKKEVKKKSQDEDEMSEGCMKLTGQKTDICSEDDIEESFNNIQTSSVNETVTNAKPVKKGKLKETPGFEESLNLQEVTDFSQLEKNISEPQVNNCEKDKQKKKKKRKGNSLEKSVNEIEMLEESTEFSNNEKLTENVEIKSKKQKKKSEIEKSMSLNGYFDLSRLAEENLEHVDNIENEKQKKKKKKNDNSLDQSVNESEITEGSVLVNEENDVSSDIRIEETCNNTQSSGRTLPVSREHLIVETESKKQKKKAGVDQSWTVDDSTEFSNNEKLTENVEIKSKKQKKKAEIEKSMSLNGYFDLSQLAEENLEHVGNIENEKQKKKKKKNDNSLEQSVNESEITEGSVLVNEENDVSSDIRIEETSNNTQSSGRTLPVSQEHLIVETESKKQKKKAGVDQSWTVDKSTDLSHLLKDNLSESVINDKENEQHIKKKKKKKTENSLSNQQNEVVMLETRTELVIKEVQSRSKSEETSKNPQRNNENTFGSNKGLTKETKTEKEKKNSNIDKKENERKKKDNTTPKKCEDTVQKKKATSYLDVCAGFFWNATPDQLPAVNVQKINNADSSSEDETEVTMNKKKKQRLTMAEKRELARQEEERLRKVEERLMEAERNPVSADDFDRLVMSDPNDSRNWIKYMAYHLEATEVEKARAVAERALKTISFREEQEKLNVWMALLNLENLYGTQESLDKTLEEAIKMNDSYKVHMQVLNMFSMTKKLEELDKMVQLVTKKYKGQKSTWIEAGLACIKCGEIEKSRQLMQRALKILDKKDHVEVLTRFARMENEWGESERAETLLENILTSYPKRNDVWSVYVDLLVKSKKFDIARQVLDRAVIQKFPASKMKFLFKKYLTFEQTHGTPDRVEKIREMAKNFVENLKSNIA